MLWFTYTPLFPHLPLARALQRVEYRETRSSNTNTPYDMCAKCLFPITVITNIDFPPVPHMSRAYHCVTKLPHKPTHTNRALIHEKNTVSSPTPVTRTEIHHESSSGASASRGSYSTIGHTLSHHPYYHPRNACELWSPRCYNHFPFWPSHQSTINHCCDTNVSPRHVSIQTSFPYHHPPMYPMSHVSMCLDHRESPLSVY